MKYSAHVTLDELQSDFVPEAVPYAAITPQGDESGPFPLCIVLHGGGGSRLSLVDCGVLFENWWSDGSLRPMVLASPSRGMSYYVEDAADSTRWDAFVAESFVEWLRATCNVRSDRSSTVIHGMSMGGYGALKIAFNYPEVFSAVAAMEACSRTGILRWPDHRAQQAASWVGRSVPADRAGSGSGSVCGQHSSQPGDSKRGADSRAGSGDLYRGWRSRFHQRPRWLEFLHRVLWDLDISHEYRLTRGADHVGPTMIPRMREAYTWLGSAQGPDGAGTQTGGGIGCHHQSALWSAGHNAGS